MGTDSDAAKQAQAGLGNFITQIVTAAAAKDLLQLGASSIEDVAFYDFSDYVFVRDPEYWQSPAPQPDVPASAALLTDDLTQQGVNANDLHLFYVRLRQAFDEHIAELATAAYGSAQMNNHQRAVYDAAYDRIIAILNSNPETLATFTAIYFALPASARAEGSGKQDYLAWIIDEYNKLYSGARLAFWSYASPANRWESAFSDAQLLGHWLTMEASALDQWSDYSPYTGIDGAGASQSWETLLSVAASPGDLDDEYPFALYRPGSANLGVRLVYRQTWRPLGNQRGELVKTIPLGPRQTDRISIRIVRRQKISHTAEDLKSTESSTETTDNSKDSSEVVRDAAHSFGWNVEASATANVGYMSATLSAGAKGSSEERSRRTSQHLTESMQRSCSKIRTETKVVVSTESETTTEEARSSEITNPNDEIAVTYGPDPIRWTG